MNIRNDQTLHIVCRSLRVGSLTTNERTNERTNDRCFVALSSSLLTVVDSVTLRCHHGHPSRRRRRRRRRRPRRVTAALPFVRLLLSFVLLSFAPSHPTPLLFGCRCYCHRRSPSPNPSLQCNANDCRCGLAYRGVFCSPAGRCEAVLCTVCVASCFDVWAGNGQERVVSRVGQVYVRDAVSDVFFEQISRARACCRDELARIRIDPL